MIELFLIFNEVCMSSIIRFGTFNVGQGYSDYSMMLSNSENEYIRLEKEIKSAVAETESGFTEEQRKTPNIREEIAELAQAKITKKIEIAVAKKLSDQCDVIALQEVVYLHRPFIKTLEEKEFKIYRYEKGNPRFSNAIALRESLFEPQVTNVSIPSKSGKDGPIYGREIAAVIAKIKNLNLEMAFSSIHSWGFQLFHPAQTNRQYSKKDLDQIKYGEDYTKEAVNNLKGRSIKVIAGDMNNNPQNQPGQFDFIKSQGFEVLEPNDITNINGYDPNCTERKIDFIFVPKQSVVQRLCSAVAAFFVSRASVTYSPAKVLDGFAYTLEGNCSDHKPVVTTITISNMPSTISRIYKYVLSFY